MSPQMHFFSLAKYSRIAMRAGCPSALNIEARVNVCSLYDSTLVIPILRLLIDLWLLNLNYLEAEVLML
jgi:hypothetical protein